MEASARGAEEFANWLDEEDQFEVATITDSSGPVTVGQIAKAVDDFVKAGTYQQLVIYFSGHGFSKNGTELWLLTDAPGDANAAVSWAETAEFAKDCGIPNVVLISDACRTLPATSREDKVRGSIIFPNEPTQRDRAIVDKFFPTAQGKSAFEICIGNPPVKKNVFTHCFLQAFKSPDAAMVREVVKDGEVIRVVPNRRLRDYLRREVPALLATVNIRLDQLPDAEVLSDEDAYIGKARQVPPDFVAAPHIVVPDAKFRPMVTPPLSAEASLTLLRTATESDSEGIPASLRTGFTVAGARIQDVAVVSKDHYAIIHSHGDDLNPGLIEIRGTHACTVVVRFANGRGAAFASLLGFVGRVVVDANKVVDVKYVPSRDLRQFFIDPTAAIHAAYALSKADRRQDVENLLVGMRHQNTHLFDIALLARQPRERAHFPLHRYFLPVPFCPMLTYGWNLLRARGVTLPPVLDEAQDELESAEWTTFKPSRVDAILEKIHSGELGELFHESSVGTRSEPGRQRSNQTERGMDYELE